MPPKWPLKRFRAGKSLVLSAVVLGLTACAPSQTSLPDAASMPSRASTDADRARHAKAMNETAATAASRQSKAVEQIEGAR